MVRFIQVLYGRRVEAEGFVYEDGEGVGVGEPFEGDHTKKQYGTPTGSPNRFVCSAPPRGRFEVSKDESSQ